MFVVRLAKAKEEARLANEKVEKLQYLQDVTENILELLENNIHLFKEEGVKEELKKAILQTFLDSDEKKEDETNRSGYHRDDIIFFTKLRFKDTFQEYSDYPLESITPKLAKKTLLSRLDIELMSALNLERRGLDFWQTVSAYLDELQDQTQLEGLEEQEKDSSKLVLISRPQSKGIVYIRETKERFRKVMGKLWEHCSNAELTQSVIKHALFNRLDNFMSAVNLERTGREFWEAVNSALDYLESKKSSQLPTKEDTLGDKEVREACLSPRDEK